MILSVLSFSIFVTFLLDEEQLGPKMQKVFSSSKSAHNSCTTGYSPMSLWSMQTPVGGEDF